MLETSLLPRSTESLTIPDDQGLFSVDAISKVKDLGIAENVRNELFRLRHLVQHQVGVAPVLA